MSHVSLATCPDPTLAIARVGAFAERLTILTVDEWLEENKPQTTQDRAFQLLGLAWGLDVFDRHRTVTSTIALFPNFCLTSPDVVR